MEADFTSVLNRIKSSFGCSVIYRTQEALLKYWEKDFDSSMEIVEAIMEEEPYRLDSLDILSNIFYVREDVQNLSVLAMNASKVNKHRPETNCIIGNYYSLKRDHEKALKYFRRGLKLNPNAWWFWTLIGHEYIEMKNINGAIEAYRKTLDQNPNDFRAWYVLGQFYQLLKMPSYAAIYYKKACEIRPKDARMWIALGGCYLSLEKQELAINFFKRAEPFDESTTALENLAKLYQESNDAKTAAIYYRKLIEKKECSQVKSKVINRYLTMSIIVLY